MAIGDRIRERRERRRAEDGLFNSTMSILYGNNWTNNGRIDPRQMRKQYDANRDMFLRQAADKAINTSFNPAIEDIQMPELSIQTTPVQQAPTPRLTPINTTPNYNPRFFRSRQNQDWWLRQANEAGKEFNRSFKTIEDVMDFQRQLGVNPDGKLKINGVSYNAALKRFRKPNPEGEQPKEVTTTQTSYKSDTPIHTGSFLGLGDIDSLRKVDEVYQPKRTINTGIGGGGQTTGKWSIDEWGGVNYK